MGKAPAGGRGERNGRGQDTRLAPGEVVPPV